MTNWSELHHALGPADDVPELLRRIAPDGDVPAWDELWKRLCVQGAVYDASFAALPRLANTLSGWVPFDRHMGLILAGSIVACADTPHGAGDVRERYRPTIAVLSRLTEESLREKGRLTPDVFVCLLQAALAFEGVDVWHTQLHGLVRQLYAVRCPGCGNEVLVLIGDRDFFTAVVDDKLEPDPSTHRDLVPTRAKDLTGIGRRLYETCAEEGQPHLAKRITYLFGTATCNKCEESYSLAEAVSTMHAGIA